MNVKYFIRQILLCLFLLTFIYPIIAIADFKQGSINIQMQTPQGDVAVKLKISPKAVRSNILLGFGQFKMDMTFLIETKENAKLYQINEAAKTYSIVDLSSEQSNIQNEKTKDPSSISYANVKIKNLGSAEILGYKVQHLSATSDDFTSEIWLSKEIGLFSTIKKLQEINKNNSSQLEIFKALEKNNYKGFPLKMWWKEKNGSKMEMYVSHIKEEKLPAELFEIPKDYKKTNGVTMTSPQNMQGIKNILENMTPEQKKALENIMKEQGK